MVSLVVLLPIASTDKRGNVSWFVTRPVVYAVVSYERTPSTNLAPVDQLWPTFSTTSSL